MSELRTQTVPKISTASAAAPAAGLPVYRPRLGVFSGISESGTKGVHFAKQKTGTAEARVINRNQLLGTHAGCKFVTAANYSVGWW